MRAAAPMPELVPARAAPGPLARSFFSWFNRLLAVPALRAGLGPWIGTPIGGWLLLLRVRGRRTGRIRDFPLSYLIAEGSIWVMAGFGRRANWYRNAMAAPAVEVILPGRQLRCEAEEVLDPETRRRIVPQLIRAIGAPAYLTGIDPYRSAPERVLEATVSLPLIRLRPVGPPLVAGPDDPGGLGWAWRQPALLLATFGVVRLLATRRPARKDAR